MGDIGRVRRGTCDQCEAEDQRLARFVVVNPDGTRRYLLVCAFCFIYLKARKPLTDR